MKQHGRTWKTMKHDENPWHQLVLSGTLICINTNSRHRYQWHKKRKLHIGKSLTTCISNGLFMYSLINSFSWCNMRLWHASPDKNTSCLYGMLSIESAFFLNLWHLVLRCSPACVRLHPIFCNRASFCTIKPRGSAWDTNWGWGATGNHQAAFWSAIWYHLEKK